MTDVDADIQRLTRYDRNWSAYTVAIITDEDHAARIELEDGLVAWASTIRYDRLYRHDDARTGIHYALEEIPPDQGGEHQLVSLLAEGGRGAEFSEFVMFGERLIAFDDRTGVLDEVRTGHQLVPRQILMTGSGDERFKGFKSEWATLKSDRPIVGSHGKTRTEAWIKSLDRSYAVESIDWQERYERIARAAGVDPNRGYVVYEAVEWHPVRQQWLFFPRKISHEPFDSRTDERECGTNVLIMTDEHFERIETIQVGERIPDRGVSSFKILPSRPWECIGLEEQRGRGLH